MWYTIQSVQDFELKSGLFGIKGGVLLEFWHSYQE